MITENPFGRSFKLLRSPTLKIGATQEKNPSMEEEPSLIDLTDHPQEDTHFQALGKELESLVEMLEDGKRRSVHQPMRDAITKAKALWDTIQVQQEANTKKRLAKDCSSQTSPLLKPTSDPKRKLGLNEQTPKGKRTQTPGKLDAMTSGKPAEKKQMARKENPAKDEPGWSTVTRKKKRNKKERKKPEKRIRPDAIIVKATGDLSYADMIRKMQADPKLEALGKAVSRIRRTQKGELLIQLKGGENSTSIFKDGLGTSLGENAEVKALTTFTTVECRDIDEISTPEDVIEAIRTQFNVDDISVGDIVMRKAYGETQTASIKTTEEKAKKLLDKGGLKLGWSVCHFREKTTLTKCFRCLEFGHIARNCKNPTDRSKMCRKCGDIGHIAKDCKGEPSCMFCKGAGKRADHVAGSGRCPTFRRALNQKS